VALPILLVANGGQGHGHQRDHRQSHSYALNKVGPEKVVAGNIQIEFTHHQGGNRQEDHARANQETVVHLPDQKAYQRREDQYAQAARSLRQAADVGGVAHEASRHERLQVHDAIQEEKDDGDENVADQKVPVGKDPQVGERFAGLEFPHDKRDKRDDGNHRERANKI
jgi:hypothetical protein